MDDSSAQTGNSQPPWEPPLAGSETQHLAASLTRLRTTFRWKADGLDTADLSRSVGSSTLTLGGLLKHLACVEDEKFGISLSGAGYGPPWAGMPDYPGPPGAYTFDIDGWAAEDLYRLWDEAVRRSEERLRTALAADGPGQRIAMGADEGLEVSLRRLLFDLLEEYGRHTGHADLIRESIDGRVGEDPPEDWHAVSGSSPVGR
ncbi:mycothiol transferase [Nakamurella endophytica]|uniref:Mini-circle protein n=1 Tax=Nakamurella endophytica TaxID=1748367 RepID=A0A917SP04_9ACTN|nr:DUF664 domain-containing protein [Nakamurella endophytica]GGL91893.1 mini-circle protein [Nakamurella endophytica]